MVRILRPGKVVVVTSGKYAGKKALVVKNKVHVDEGTKEKPFGHCYVVGVERAPLKITKAMSAKKVKRRSRVKPFMKLVNYSHLMPTRYSVDLDLKSIVTQEALQDPERKKKTRKEIRKLLEERYHSGQNKWFFQKLRF